MSTSFLSQVTISISSSSSSPTGYPLDDGKGNVHCAVKKTLESFESAEQRKSTRAIAIQPAPAPTAADGGGD